MEAIAKMAPDVTDSESKSGHSSDMVLHIWVEPFTTPALQFVSD